MAVGTLRKTALGAPRVSIGPDVLRHRVLVSYEAEAQDMTSDDLIQQIFNTVDVP